MRRKLARIGNSRGVILSRDGLDLLGVTGGSEVELELLGHTPIVTAPEPDRAEGEAALAYLASKRERGEVYRSLAE
jgi:antitoxin component of MazEF toxin-antitoxin module